MRDVALPLGESIKTTGSARGRLDLKDLKLENGGMLAELLGAMGVNRIGLNDVTTDGLDFRIRNGRVEYDNFKLVFVGLYDMRFNGSVGFDETLQLTVWLPVRPALLEKLKIPAPPAILGVLEKLGHVPVFIGGTVKKPTYDWRQAAREIPGMILKAGPSILDGLLKSPEKDPKDDPNEDPKKDDDRKEPGGLFDSILDILGDPKDKPKQMP